MVPKISLHPGLLLIYIIIHSTIDTLYLRITAAMYGNHLRAVQGGRKVILWMPAAVACYALLFTGVWFYVIRDVLTNGSASTVPALTVVVSRAALLGFVVYGVYNLTNLATLVNYSAHVAAIDTVWGVSAITVISVAMWVIKVSWFT
jgi:uncharacterized membrane protein